jgi:TolB-like protein
MNKPLIKTLSLSCLLLVTACQTYSGSSLSASQESPYYGSRTAYSSLGYWGNDATYTDNALAVQTYKAVDRIISQAGMVSGDATPVVVGTLANVDTMERSQTFGRTVAEQVSARLTQNGYNVSELKLRNSLNIKQGQVDGSEAGEYILTRDIESVRQEYKIGRVVTGTYSIAGREIMVNLKMIDIATGRIMGATDYAVALDANTTKLIQGNNFSFYGSSMAY